MRTALSAVAVAALTVVTAVTTRTPGFTPSHRPVLAWWLAAGWVLFGLALLALRRVPERRVVPLVLAGSLAVGVAALVGPPNMSTDSARYAWDGIVQDAGTSPYAYVPADDHLAGLRTDWLFPAPDVAADGTVTCDELRVQPTTTVPSGAPLCTALNRPQVPTIYPPVAEAYFAAVRAPVPSGAEYWPLQVSGLLVGLGLTGALLVGMRRRGMAARWAAVWGWCPFVAEEVVTNSHVDGLGTLLLVLATLAATSDLAWLRRGATDRRPLVAGVLLGLATATKVIPALAAPPLLRRHGWRTAAAAVVTVALVYVPYVAVSGTGVLGYLSGYLDEEGYDSGARFALVTLVVPGTAATVVALLLVAALAVWSWWRADPDRPWLTQVVLIGGTLLVVRPATAWYAVLLLPFVALSRRWEWLALPVGLQASQMFGDGVVERWAMGACLAVVVGAAAWRRWGSGDAPDPDGGVAGSAHPHDTDLTSTARSTA
ncbi:glycosyltransferase 87 family protein [Luteimicrobium subarcticum]|uniref:Uncharacterized protein DUF2029 n=1 Tax=Luteimicrobium subarcticum TaxID=620910 RepID=A0A2M8W1T3_9MICO|nr:glycosyltransferase 87 family protein [Luteimicrobium subarcticum]PJI84887.1 uncharacterized protein DUF2029 [Luteimicrobium subarcticum]